MTPNVALAQNTHHRMVEQNIHCCYYKDTTLFKSSHDKYKLNNYDNLIICINSLHYLKPDKKYKCVVIDEIESLLIKWHNNNTFNEKANYKIDCWNNFVNIIRNAERVILLDAFTTNLTTNFINMVCGYQTYNIYELTDADFKRDVYILETYQHWVYQILADLKLGKKLFIFYPFKGKSRYLPSMSTFVKLLEAKTGTKGLYYNADVDDTVLKTLSDVNHNWSQYSFVVTNTKITVGINFDRVYALIAGYNLSRDVIQATYRCRTLNDNSIHVCFVDKLNTNFCFKNDAPDVDNCPIYVNMVRDILKEKQAPLISSFNLFCSKANYKICSNENSISTELTKQISLMLNATENICYNFDSLPNYNFDTVKLIEQKLYSQTATLEDKLSIQKYYFKQKYIHTADKTKLANIWDDNCLFLMDKVAELKHSDDSAGAWSTATCTRERRYGCKPCLLSGDNIFEKIKVHNKWSSIFPSEKQLNKSKLDDTLRDEIFNEYHFTKLTKAKSTSNVILKNIYNSYFNKHVITSISDGNKHYKLSISDAIYEFYQFGQNNLKVYTQPIEIDDPFIDDEIAKLLDRTIETDEEQMEEQFNCIPIDEEAVKYPTNANVVDEAVNEEAVKKLKQQAKFILFDDE